MSLLDRLLASRAPRALAMATGIGGIFALVALVFPATRSTIIPWLGGTYLALLILGALVIGFDQVGRKLWARYITGLREAIGYQKPSDSLPEPKTPDRVDDGEKAYRYSAARYGIGYDDLGVECIINQDGSATVTRRVNVEAFSQIERLDTFLVIGEQPPEGQTWDIDLLEVRSLFPGMKVSLLDISEAQGRLSALLGLDPPLIKGQQLQYEMREELPAGLYAIDLTEEKRAKRKTPHDYFGWTISRPTRKLQLRVFFPERLKPEDYGLEVRYASAAPGIPSSTFQLEEQVGLGRPSLHGPQADRYFLTLEVEHPMTGLIYILRWEPLRGESEKRHAKETPFTRPSVSKSQEQVAKETDLPNTLPP